MIRFWRNSRVWRFRNKLKWLSTTSLLGTTVDLFVENSARNYNRVFEWTINQLVGSLPTICPAQEDYKRTFNPLSDISWVPTPNLCYPSTTLPPSPTPFVPVSCNRITVNTSTGIKLLYSWNAFNQLGLEIPKYSLLIMDIICGILRNLFPIHVQYT